MIGFPDKDYYPPHHFRWPRRLRAEEQDQVDYELDKLEMFEAHMRPPETDDCDPESQ